MQVDQGIGCAGYHIHHYGNRDWRFYRFLLSLVISRSDPGRILDVGCGTGLLVEAASRWGLECSGIDGSEEAVSIALQRCPSLRVRQHVLSSRFPFPDAHFETVILNQVIEHLEPRVVGACLTESFRVLNQGGMIYIASPSRFNRKERMADPTHIRLYSPSELRSLLLRCGFTRITALNDPLHVFGERRAARLAAGMLFWISRLDRLSASATCVAYKPPSVQGR